MEVRRDQRKAVYNFSVHDLVWRNHIDRSGPRAGRNSNVNNVKPSQIQYLFRKDDKRQDFTFLRFYDDQKFYSVVSPANVVILVNDHHSFASSLLFSASAQTCNRIVSSHELFGAFSSVI